MSRDDEEFELHETAVEIHKSIQIPEGAPQRASLGAKATKAWKESLRHQTGDKHLFVSLAVMGARLLESSVTEAGRELIDLARLGLDPNELEKIGAAEDGCRQAAEAIAEPTSGKQRGLGLKSAAPTFGVRLRGGTKRRR